MIKRIVETNDKQRFALKENETDHRLMIRANQGHSIQQLNVRITTLFVR